LPITYVEGTRDLVGRDISGACQVDNLTATHDYTVIDGGLYIEVHSGLATEFFEQLITLC